MIYEINECLKLYFIQFKRKNNKLELKFVEYSYDIYLLCTIHKLRRIESGGERRGKEGKSDPLGMDIFQIFNS